MNETRISRRTKHVLLRVINNLVNIVLSQGIVLPCLVGVDLSERRHVVEDGILQGFAFYVGNNLGADLSQFAVKDAEKTGRRCFAMELDPRYCDVIIKRWEEATGRTATLENT